MLYAGSITMDFYVQAESFKEAKEKIKRIAEDLEEGEGIDPFSELGLTEQLEVSNMSGMP